MDAACRESWEFSPAGDRSIHRIGFDFWCITSWAKGGEEGKKSLGNRLVVFVWLFYVVFVFKRVTGCWGLMKILKGRYFILYKYNWYNLVKVNFSRGKLTPHQLWQPFFKEFWGIKSSDGRQPAAACSLSQVDYYKIKPIHRSLSHRSNIFLATNVEQFNIRVKKNASWLFGPFADQYMAIYFVWCFNIIMLCIAGRTETWFCTPRHSEIFVSHVEIASLETNLSKDKLVNFGLRKAAKGHWGLNETFLPKFFFQKWGNLSKELTYQLQQADCRRAACFSRSATNPLTSERALRRPGRGRNAVRVFQRKLVLFDCAQFFFRAKNWCLTCFDTLRHEHYTWSFEAMDHQENDGVHWAFNRLGFFTGLSSWGFVRSDEATAYWVMFLPVLLWLAYGCWSKNKASETFRTTVF